MLISKKNMPIYFVYFQPSCTDKIILALLRLNQKIPIRPYNIIKKEHWVNAPANPLD